MIDGDRVVDQAMPDEITVVYDVEQMRPACAIIQALGGGTPGVSHLFPSQSWLVHPTDGMRTLVVSPDELEELVERTEE